MIAYLKPMAPDQEPIVLDDFFTIGASESCSRALFDKSVSERHARIEKRGEAAYFLKDMRSAAGTFINDIRIFEAEIQPGDILKFGSCEFQFCLMTTNAECQLKSKNEVWSRELQSLVNLSKTSFPVLLLGPSGTGKDIIAQEIHRCSPRATAPFVSVNCSALTETLVESELFGHVKGSFTGAICDRKGAFETARGGTLFLDEIGDLPYSLQAKLLRALENSEIHPVGSDRNIKTNVRIIAATHQNLTEKIQAGEFRSDLYFRLNVIQMSPPPLACRMEDFEDILMDFARTYRVRFSIPAITRMKKHIWPGNIRELKNVVARARALYPETYILEDHIENLLDKPLNFITTSGASSASLPVMKEIEKQMIIKRLAANKGNQRRTAQDLGMPKSTLHDRLKYYSIDIDQYKV